MQIESATIPYRGRIAPSPTGLLHLGHARTFWVAAKRCADAAGTLILRDEDLDSDRCRREFSTAAVADLLWLGLTWSEGPDVGGPAGAYRQSERLAAYRDVFAKLAATGVIYPSPHSRKDVQSALQAPHEEPTGTDREPLFPVELRPATGVGLGAVEPGAVNWRFRVPDGRRIAFDDAVHGRVTRVAGVDFGDFVVWRKDGFPAYELAVVADDAAMNVTEVVRGADLLTSTARQLLIYESLGWSPPRWCHVPLLHDAEGRRLAKRTAALSLQTMRESGVTPESLRAEFAQWWSQAERSGG